MVSDTATDRGSSRPIDRPGTPAYASGLPAPLTPFAGREREVTQVTAIVSREDTRLLTLTGPGGIGKTRLAIRVAEETASGFPDGVVFVPLAAVRDPDFVVPTIAQAVGVRSFGDRPLVRQVAAVLGRCRLLLVLDNLEQVVAAAPRLAELLGACPRLTILATSRTVLHLSGEREFAVPPLGLLPPQASPDEALESSEAVRFFAERARAVSPHFVLDPTTAPLAAEVCRRLDGVPLAIELAAARLRHLPLEALTGRLDRRLALLTGGSHDQPVRHRTMRDAIAWSYELLEEDERRFFRCLAVFNGGFTPDAAAAVGELDDELAALDAIASLVDKSLLRQAEPGDDVRYLMLETIREFALAQLTASGELEEARRRQANWCLAFMERVWPHFVDRAGQELWIRRCDAERDNIRAALGWLADQRKVAEFVQLAGSLYWVWYIHGQLQEGLGWLTRAAEMDGLEEVSPELRARMLVALSILTYFRGDVAEAEARVRQALPLSLEAGYEWGSSIGAFFLGVILAVQGRFEEAAACYEDAIARYQASGVPPNTALAMSHLGVVTWELGEPDRAVALCEEALALQRHHADQWGLATALGWLGLLLALRGEAGRAGEILVEAFNVARELGAQQEIAGNLANLGLLAALQERFELAAYLFGREDQLTAMTGSVLRMPLRTRHVRDALDAARTSLGAERFEAHWNLGRRATLDEAAAAVSQLLPPGTHAPRQPDSPREHGSRPAGLTEREVEVLQLVAQGKTNPEIATALFISRGTARIHVSNILGKLGAHTRTEAVDLARQRGII
jgi:non-specific serine/threonine protein kinase